jgi:hypothetical protein
MPKDTRNVIHQQGRVFKYLMIDALEDVAHRNSTLEILNRKGIVNVAASIRSSAHKISVDAKRFTYRFYVVLAYHVLTLLGTENVLKVNRSDRIDLMV